MKAFGFQWLLSVPTFPCPTSTLFPMSRAQCFLKAERKVHPGRGCVTMPPGLRGTQGEPFPPALETRGPTKERVWMGRAHCPPPGDERASVKETLPRTKRNTFRFLEAFPMLFSHPAAKLRSGMKDAFLGREGKRRAKGPGNSQGWSFHSPALALSSLSRLQETVIFHPPDRTLVADGNENYPWKPWKQVFKLSS